MGKVIPLRRLSEEIKQIKKAGNTIVLVGGCFDIIHAAHIEFLKRSKNLGGILIVILESDETVKKLKGKDRPINNQQDRAKILSHLKSVDYVLPIAHFETDDDYFNLVKKLKPDIIAVTSPDPIFDKKMEQAKLVGAKVVEAMKIDRRHSTTSLVHKVNTRLIL